MTAPDRDKQKSLPNEVLLNTPDSIQSRGRTWGEILLVLSLSLGASAIYSIVIIIDRLTQSTAISKQTATLNAPMSSREVFDFIYQFLGIFFDLVPVALVCYLLWQTTRPHLSRIGLHSDGYFRDALSGIGLALLIGIPGIGLYAFGRMIGITVHVIPTSLTEHWWTIPILLFSAARAALSEELIVVGYLFARLRELAWGRWLIILSTAVLRGSYHLYQGIGSFFGNFAMGVLFGWLYSRTGRVLPLVIAHFVIDAAIFVGYPFVASAFTWL
ncbi:MAG: CPBP family intramembrane metalloprotease [Cryobacterium sp.]|nr:CPBP family intramembrane metalloprotease [Cryobacterium sp.]